MLGGTQPIHLSEGLGQPFEGEYASSISDDGVTSEPPKGVRLLVQENRSWAEGH